MIEKGGYWIRIVFFLLGMIPEILTSQVLISATGKPASLIICYDDGTFSFLIANTTGATISGATLLIDLPAGCIYTPGSVSGASQLNISNLNQPTFSLPDIPNNTAHPVSYNAGLICGYTNTENFNYIVTYNSINYTGFDTPLQNYYFPVLVISNITNASASIPVGQSITRDITIEQQGLNSTMDTLIILDSHTADIEVLSTSIGTLHPYVGAGPTIVDTIIITGADLPGANDLFDYGESLVVSETVKLVGCTNGQSTLKTTWGCYHQVGGSYTSFPSVSPAAGSTVINLSLTGNRKDWSFIDDSGWVEFTVTNNGSGYGTAFNLVILAGFSSGGSTYYPNSNWINEIDSFSINGNYLPASYNYAGGATNGQYAYYTDCPFTYDPDGTGVGLDDLDADGYFDDLPVGQTITVKAHTYYDWNEAYSSIATRNSCGHGWTNSAWQAFRFGYNYMDQCLDYYGVHWIPNGNLCVLQTYNTITTQHTIPPDIFDGETVWMEQSVNTSTALSSQCCQNDSVIYKVILPQGVTIGPGTATFKNVSMGTAVMRGDTAIYELNRSRILSGGSFLVPIMIECESDPPPLGSISTRLQVWCDKYLYKDRYFTYWCSTTPIFGIQCPTGSCPDPSITSFSVKRLTMGWTDNTCTTRVNPSVSGLRLDNAMAGDTIRIEASGLLNGNIDSLYFRLQHDAMPGAWGNQLFFTLLTDTLIYYCSAIDRTDTCVNLSPQISNGTTSYLTTYFGDLTASGGCLNGISFSSGDSLRYVITGKIRSVARNNWETVPVFRGRFYWQENGLEEFCNDRGVTFNVLGSNYPFVTTTFYQQIILQGCTSFQYEGLIYRSLDACGGDATFPGEIRPYCVLDSMTFILPEGFVYETGSSRHGYFNDNGGLVNETISDPQIDINSSGTHLIYVRDSFWHYSDYYDCYNNRDRITFYASPSCEASGNYSYQMNASGRYLFYMDGQGIDYTGSGSKSITYTPPSVSLTPIPPTAEGREDTITWEIRLCNLQSFDAGNNWLGFEHPAEGITVVRVIDISNPISPVSYPASSYAPGKTWVQLGSLIGSSCRNFLVKATYTICDFDSLLIRHGFNCAGYPVDPDLGYPPSGYICTENSSYLYLDPKDVALNLAITSPANPVNLCDTLVYEAVVTNTQLSYAFDLKLTLALPPGLTVVPGGSRFKYPYSTGSFLPLGDPVNLPAGSNRWVYNISSDPNGVLYLLGVDSLPKNGFLIQYKMITNCDFTSGKSVQVIASASNACGEVVTRSSYTQSILITDIPTSVNLYVINTTTGERFQTCSEETPIHVKVINLGPSSVSTIEKLKITIDDAFDIVDGSLTNIHNGPSGLTNSVIAGIRYLDFSIEPNLEVNDSIVFSFSLEDIDPGSLNCDTIPLETNTLLVARVYCQTVPGDSCSIYSITSTQVQFKPVSKDHLAFGRYTASSIPDGISGETVTIHLTVKNTGLDTINSSSAGILFVHDANNNGIPDDIGADSLHFQVSPLGVIMPGDSTVLTAIFDVPADKICKMLAALRLSDNTCICGDIVKPINNIHLLNGGPDVEVCMQTDIQLGLPGITGYNYYWVPTLFLSSPTIADPIFNYNTLLTQADTSDYFINTTRPGSCVTRDTVQVIVLPSAVAFAGENTEACRGYPHLLADADVINSGTVSWSTSGSGSFDDPILLHATYTPSPSDYANGMVTLTLFADGLCGDDSDEMILTFNDPATSSAGPDTAICSNWVYAITHATASNFTSLLWISLGDGTFNNATILDPTYTPGPGDITNGSVPLVLQAAGYPSCPTVADTMMLVLTPPPSITNSPPEKTICSEQYTSILLTSSQPGTSFSWSATLTSGTVTGFGNGSGDTIDQQLFNPGIIPGIVTYTITPNNGGCIGIPLDYLVTVNPLPTITNSNTDSSFCSGGTTDINLDATISGTSFSWSASATSSFITGYSDGNGAFISQTLVNSGTQSDTVIYSVTPSFSDCYGADSLFFITVYPLPDVLADPSVTSLCSGDTAMIILSSSVAGSSFTWTATPSSTYLSGFTSGSGDTIAQILSNSGTTIDTVVYTITPMANGCVGAAVNVPVIVLPIPLVTTSFSPLTICSDDTVLFLLGSNVSGTGYSWTSSSSGNLTGFHDGSGDTICQVISNTGYTIDTLFYFITPDANGCSGETVSVYSLVNPVPDLSNQPLSTGICNDAWSNVSLFSHVAGTAFTWSCSQISGNVSGWSANPIPSTLLNQQLFNSGTSTDSVIYHMIPEANGCSGWVTDYVVNVFPLPDVHFNPQSPVVCSEEVTAIQCLSQVPSSTFSWTTSVNPNVSGNHAGSGNLIADTLVNPGLMIETIYYIATPEAFGCPPGIPDTVYVEINPLPAVTNSDRSFFICNLEPFEIPLQSNLSYPATYSWTAFCSSPLVSGYGDGSGDTIQQLISNAGFSVDTVYYIVTATSNNCQGDTTHFQVIVYPVPDVISSPPYDTICSGDTCQIDLASHVIGTSFTWTASPGSLYLSGFSPGSGEQISQQLLNTAFTPGMVMYQISPSANGCQGILDQVEIVVNPSPSVSLAVCFDTITHSGAQPIFLRGGIPHDGSFSGNYVTANTFDPISAGPGIHPIWYTYTNRFSCTRSDTLFIHVLADTPFTCGDTVTDIRDGNKYPTVQIGTQCWLAANLNYGIQILHTTVQRDNCLPEKYCYLNQLARCTTSGGLYQWDEMMEYSESPGNKGFCPPGWHVPDEGDWGTLFANFINNAFAGNPLKIEGYSGFNALLSGVRFNNNVWKLGPEEPIINATFIWSSESYGPEKAWSHSMIHLLADPEYTPSVSFYPSSRINAFAVRCLKD